jgi:hypothetical protein
MRRSIALLLAFALGACSTTEPTPSPAATTATSAPPGTASTPEPVRTTIPGYEAWATINPQAVRITLEDEDLLLELIGAQLWFNAERGVLFHTEVTGDFRVAATVRTSKTSDRDAPPGRDGTIQLAGLMARAEVPVENSVFIVTGSIGHGTGIETKTTASSHSIYVQRGIGADGDADLLLCRRGSTFGLSWRAPGSADPWQTVSTFERPDLPATLQVGVNIYTDAVPDLTARFEDLSVEPQPDGGPC